MTSANMRVWLYYRLSRDDDKELNSLTNQKRILETYAAQNGHTVVGESYDDNLSGVHFDTRKGIVELIEAAEARIIDAVFVKDLSRLGRNKALTPLLIEDLRRHGVRLVSVTENLDSFNPNDDLIMGIKHVINEGYSKDTSRKISAGFDAKLKEQGIIMIPPFGYRKVYLSKTEYSIEIVEECAEIVRKIFELYVGGYGYHKIAEHLIDRNIPSPAYYQLKHYNKKLPYNKTSIGKKYLWSTKSISAVLGNEAYIGTLINHKSKKSTIYRTRTLLPIQEQYRHESIYPPIISDELWAQACAIKEHRKGRKGSGPRNKPIYRYSGLLICGDCGATFVAKNRQSYIEYVCNTYHRVSKKYCASHRVRDCDLDEKVFAELEKIVRTAQVNWTALDAQVNTWNRLVAANEKKITALLAEKERVHDTIKSIMLQRIQEPERATLYDEMLSDHERQEAMLDEQITTLKSIMENAEAEKVKLRSALEIMTSILKERNLGNGHLIMIINRIIVTDAGDNLVNIKLELKAKYAQHMQEGPTEENAPGIEHFAFATI